jgi:uncharacterized protein
MPADRLLVFGRRPAAGRVKTRLSPPLPPDEAAAVYEACLRDVITHAARERASVELWYAEDGQGDDAAAYFAREYPHVRREPQAAGDLGERMRSAFERSFADGATRVVIIGSDAPTVPESVYGAALDDLHEADAVIAPTVDGGYYLIGLAAAAWPRAERVFLGVPWSTERVFPITVERAAEAGLDLRVLPGWYDIDVAADLRRAQADVRPESHLARWLSGAHALGWLRAP